MPGWALNSLDLAGQIANLSVGKVGRATLFSLAKLAAGAGVVAAVA